jgi:hypothetical protein
MSTTGSKASGKGNRTALVSEVIADFQEPREVLQGTCKVHDASNTETRGNEFGECETQAKDFDMESQLLV